MRANGDGLRLNEVTGIWQVDITVPGAGRVQRSTRTKDRVEAEKVRNAVRAELEAAASAPASSRHTWEEAETAYIERARRRGNRALSDVLKQLVWLRPHMVGPLSRIDRGHVSAVLKRKETDGVQRMKGGEWVRVRDASHSTINRYYATIAAVLNVAKAQGWIDSVPGWERYSEDPRVEYLSRADWAKLKAQLPEHLRILASFAVGTGQRQHVVTHLEWSHVHMDRRMLVLPASTQKNKRPLGVPLSAEAAAILAGQVGKHPRWVFPFGPENDKGERGPIVQPAGAAWRKALVRAGLPRAFRWHSLRSTWAIWHLEAGTPLEVVMRLGGWKRMDVLVRHYAHFTQGISDRYIDNAASL